MNEATEGARATDGARGWLESLPAAVLVVDAALAVRFANRRARALFEIDLGAPLAPSMTRLLDDGAISTLRAFLARPLGDDDASIQTRLTRGERHERWVSWSSSVDVDGSHLLLAHDITDHKRAETARREAETRAKDVNGFLDAIIENIPDMIFVKDGKNLAFERMNRAGEVLLGIPRSELLGKNDYDFFPKEEAEFFQNLDRSTLENGALVDIPEEPIQTRHGTRWLHTKKVPIVDDDGTPRYLLGISSDITDRKATLAELVRAKEASDAANSELEAFSYSVAHDLRAPLRGIDGFSQALLDDYAKVLDDEGKKYLRFVRDSATRMSELIDDLLSLSRVTRAELARSEVDLSLLAETAMATLRASEPNRDVEISIAPSIAGNGDARLLAVLFDNLLGNAWKFTRGKKAARIEFSSSVEPEGVVYWVRDNGAGFDMEFSSKLFGVFQRLHSAAQFEGTGIGLATVQRIVRRHAGRVWAEGVVGSGATFYFTLGAPEMRA